MVKNETVVIVEVENFECAENIAISKDQFVPCLAENRHFLKIDLTKKNILWDGFGCRHYGVKIGKEVSPKMAISLCQISKKKELLKLKQAQKSIERINKALGLIKEWEKNE